MSHSSLRPTRFAAGAVLLSVFLITACTASTSNEDKGANSSPSPVSSSARTPAEPSEKKLTEQAQATLAAVHDGTLVEAGAERVTDGIHTEPALGKGKTYKLNLVCVGVGSARLKFVPA